MADSGTYALTVDQYKKNIPFLQIAQLLNVKRVIDHATKEGGKKYFKVEWEDTWVEMDHMMKHFPKHVQQYKEQTKPEIELMAHTEDNDNPYLTVLLLRAPTSCINLGKETSVYSLSGQALLEKVKELHRQLNHSIQHKSDGKTEKTLVEHASSDLPSFESCLYNDESCESQTLLHYGHTNDHEVSNKLAAAQRKKYNFQHFKCDHCDAEFLHRMHLKIHERTHTGEKPYTCDICGRGFAQKGNLHVHEKIHTGIKDYVCHFCMKGFVTNAQLAVHLRTHTHPKRKRNYWRSWKLNTVPPSAASATDSTKSGKEVEDGSCYEVLDAPASMVNDNSAMLQFLNEQSSHVNRAVQDSTVKL